MILNRNIPELVAGAVTAIGFVCLCWWMLKQLHKAGYKKIELEDRP